MVAGAQAACIPRSEVPASARVGSVSRRGFSLLVVSLILAAGCGAQAHEDTAATPGTGPSETLAAPVGDLFADGPVRLLDEDVVGPPYYPEAQALSPAGGPRPSDSELLSEARTLTAARDPSLSDAAARRFEDPALAQRVPDPALRAALVSLLGTVAAPAVDWYASSPRFTRVEFGPVGDGAIAKSITETGGGQRIVIDSRFRDERPALLSVVLAHEAFHSDGRASDLEELVAVAVQALVHMQQLLADPTIADERTELAQSTNAWVVIRLNTHEAGSSDLRLVLSDDAPSVLPGGLERPYFAAFFDPLADPTPGNRYLQETAAAVGESAAGPPASLDFDVQAVMFFDTNQGPLTEAELVRVAGLLDLDVGPTA
jgi:hypothetical protein